MPETAWRKVRLEEALARDDIRARVRAAVAAGPLCDHCVGRLLANVDSGLANAERGRRIRAAIGAAPAAETCGLCGGLFDSIDSWAARAQEAIRGYQFDTLAVASHTDPGIEQREQSLWQLAGGDLAEPYKQAFNRALGIRLCDTLGCGTDLQYPDLIMITHHVTGQVAVRVEPLFASGRYRKLVRGMPQSRWRGWRTSIQQIVGDPICRAAEGRDHSFHGCGREDVDVRCLGQRPFVVEVLQPRRRHLDWAALAAGINRGGQVEVLDLERCNRGEVARLKELRPQKSYRALVRLAAEVDEARLAGLAGLVGLIQQQTPTRVLKRRADLERTRRIYNLEWRRVGARTFELSVRAQAGTYIKELISGDGGRTRPSVAAVLGVTAECAELDVTAIHID